MSDPITATTQLLAAALAPVPAFGHELPEDQDASMPKKAIVVSGAGGPGSGGYLPLDRARIDIRSYGATHAEAMDVAIAAHATLKGLRRTVVDDVVVHAFDPAGGYVGLREPETRWPLVLRSYIATYDERAVA